MEKANLGKILMLLSSGEGMAADRPATGRELECKTCSRRFSSFQVLGGHRASHKRPRLTEPGGCGPAKPLANECVICGHEFEVGQALGGHMRRHRAGAAESSAGKLAGERRTKAEEKRGTGIDLNLPAVEVEEEVRLAAEAAGLY